jgi:hypothetical protein
MIPSEAAGLQHPPAAPSNAAGSMAQGSNGRGGKPSRRGTAAPPPGNAQGPPQRAADHAFELWLNRGLHQLYDDVAKEPLPEELLRLIEQDKAAPRK